METLVATVYATFENGVFVPEQPVQLPAGTRVQLILNDLPPAVSAEEREKAWQEFDDFCDQNLIGSDGKMMTRDELHERR